MGRSIIEVYLLTLIPDNEVFHYRRVCVSNDRKIAWVALLIGVVGLIPIFRESNWKWSALVVLIVALIGAYLIYTEWRFTRSAITTLSLKKHVVISDIGGTKAKLIRTQTVRANYAFVNETWFRNMVTDGNFGPVTIDGESPSRVATMGCLTSYMKMFNPPLSRGMKKEVRLECDVSNSFPASEEGLLHEVAQDTRHLILEVQLPKERVCKTAQLLLEAAGEPARKLDDPEISDDRCTIRSTIKMPHTGYTYHLHWTW